MYKETQIRYSYDGDNEPDCSGLFMEGLVYCTSFINLIMGCDFAIDEVIFISKVEDIEPKFRDLPIFPVYDDDKKLIIVNLVKLSSINSDKSFLPDIIGCIALLSKFDRCLDLSMSKMGIKSPNSFCVVILLNMVIFDRKYNKGYFSVERKGVV